MAIHDRTEELKAASVSSNAYTINKQGSWVTSEADKRRLHEEHALFHQQQYQEEQRRQELRRQEAMMGNYYQPNLPQAAPVTPNMQGVNMQNKPELESYNQIFQRVKEEKAIARQPIRNEFAEVRERFERCAEEVLKTVTRYIPADNAQVEKANGRYQVNHNQFKHETLYENNIRGKTVYVQTAHNYVFPINPTIKEGSSLSRRTEMGYLHITDVYILPNLEALRRTMELINDGVMQTPGVPTTHDLSITAKALLVGVSEYANASENYMQPDSYVLRLTRKVSGEAIGLQSRLYVPGHNIALSYDESIVLSPHPFDLEVMRANQSAVSDLLVPAKGTYSISVDLVDNDQRVKARWINAFGKAMKVKPHEDALRADGAYVTQYLDGNKIDGKEVYYPLSNLDEAHLYESEEDAISHGNAELLAERHRRERMAMETDLCRTKKETEEVKTFGSVDKLNQEFELTKAKAEAEIKKMAYDGVNNIVKTLGVIATTIVTIIGLFLKFKKESNVNA